MGDIIEVWEASGNKIVIEEIINADHDITKNPDKNKVTTVKKE